MENENLKLCDNLLQGGGGIIHTLSVTLTRKGRKVK